MPCNCDYMNPNDREKELSKVACLLDEIDNKQWSQSDWEGYHPYVYNKHLDKRVADEMVGDLCSILQNKDVTKYSLEMQIWWRNHQAADKKRLEEDRARLKTEQEKKAALSKLSDYEKKLLGLD